MASYVVICGAALILAAALLALASESTLSLLVIWGSLYVWIMAWCALLASLAWAPFGALICAAVAWRRGLPPGEYAVAGALRSATLVLPWIFLLARMSGLPAPKFLRALERVCMHVAIYGLWMFGSVLHLLSLREVFWLSPISNVYLVSAPLSFGALVVSAMTTRRADSLSAPTRADGDAPPRPAYAMQFIYFSFWLAVPFVLMFIGREPREIALFEIAAFGATIAFESLVLAWMVWDWRRIGAKRRPDSGARYGLDRSV